MGNAQRILRECVKSEIEGTHDKASLRILTDLKKLIQSDLVMACIPVNSENEAFTIFETLNDRGLRLSVPDLLLNYLMKQAAGKERKVVREYWTEMIESLRKADVDIFLRALWVSKYGDLKQKNLFLALKELIQKEKAKSVDFALSCNNECAQYVRIINFDEEYLKGAAPHVRNILTLSQKAASPFLLSAFQKLPRQDFIKACKYVLVFITKSLVIVERSSSEIENVLFALARKVREMVKDGSDRKSPCVVDCMKHIKDTLSKASPDDDAVEAAVATVSLSSPHAGYVIRRLAGYMQSKTKEVDLKDATLEHIYPQRPNPNEWGGKANQERLEAHLWDIGNLTMLGEEINSRRCSNKEYKSVKRHHYAKTSELKISQQIARDYEDWGVDSIQDRSKKLAKSILAVWNFDHTARV